VDPFSGTGTCLVSATKHGMFFVGNDLSRQSIRICQHRLDLG
jgi:tRNA G10  N-methylase Trm11